MNLDTVIRNVDEIDAHDWNTRSAGLCAKTSSS
jgi:hypothetical protein